MDILEETGTADCWALAEFSARVLYENNISAKVEQGVTSESDAHRRVRALINGEWILFEPTAVTPQYNSPEGWRSDWGSGYKDVQLFIHGIEEDRMSVVPIWDVLEASTRVKDFIEEYNRTPRTVGVATETVSRESFNRMMLASVLEIFEDTYRNILLMDIGTAPNPTGNMQDSRMDLEDYMDSAKRAFMWIMERERMPNFVSTPLGNMSPFNLTDMYSRILNFYREHERLPNYVTVQRERGAPSDNIGGNLTSQLRTALGSNFSNATGLWSALRRRPYSFYFNSRYTENQRLQRISQGLGLNCTDYSLVLYKVLKELGYEVHAVRGRY